MRLAFWPKGSDKAVVQRALSKPASVAAEPVAAPPSGDLDLHALGETLKRKRGWIIVPTVLAFVVSLAAVNMVTPRYKSEARILIDGRENVFLRPSGERSEERTALDPEAVTSQVQLLLSRDLAHLCRMSGVGAVVLEEKIPVHDDAIEARRDGRSPLEHALHDGEDYELLFTMDPGDLAFATTKGTKLYVIGASSRSSVERSGSSQGGSASICPRRVGASSTMNPGPSVAISCRIPSGMRK